MSAAPEFQKLFSELEVKATQSLISDWERRISDLELTLKDTELKWAKLHVKRNIFSANALTTEEKKALEPHVILAARDDIKRARTQLEALQNHLAALTG